VSCLCFYPMRPLTGKVNWKSLFSLKNWSNTDISIKIILFEWNSNRVRQYVQICSCIKVRNHCVSGLLDLAIRAKRAWLDWICQCQKLWKEFAVYCPKKQLARRPDLLSTYEQKFEDINEFVGHWLKILRCSWYQNLFRKILPFWLKQISKGEKSKLHCERRYWTRGIF